MKTITLAFGIIGIACCAVAQTGSGRFYGTPPDAVTVTSIAQSAVAASASSFIASTNGGGTNTTLAGPTFTTNVNGIAGVFQGPIGLAAQSTTNLIPGTMQYLPISTNGNACLRFVTADTNVVYLMLSMPGGFNMPTNGWLAFGSAPVAPFTFTGTNQTGLQFWLGTNVANIPNGFLTISNGLVGIGKANPTVTLDVNGAISTSSTITIANPGAGALIFSGAGGGITFKSGSNARIGVATLVAGAVTVSNTSVTTNDIIVLGYAYDGGGHAGNQGGTLMCTNIVNGTSFDIKSSNGADSNMVRFLLFKSN